SWQPRLALRGVLLRARELDRPHGLVAHDPGIVAGLDLVGLPGTELGLAAVVGLHVQPAREDVADVVGLTRVRLRDRLHALRPSPARLEGVPADGGPPDPDHLDLSVVEGPGLVRAFQAPVRHTHRNLHSLTEVMT